MDFQSFLKDSCQRIADKNLFSILTVPSNNQDPYIDSISGNKFYQEVNRITTVLQLSEIANKKVYILADNSFSLLVVFFASLNLGCQVSIADAKLTANELNQITNDFNPDILIADDSKVEICRSLDVFKTNHTRLLEISDLLSTSDKMISPLSKEVSNTLPPQVIVYTSGTSGKAKGVVLDISAIIFEAQSLMESFERDYSKRKCFSILPLNHVYGLTTAIFTSLWADQEVFLTQSLAPQHIRLIIQEHKPYYLYVVPQFLTLIRNKVFDSLSKKPVFTQKIAKLFLQLNKHLRSRWIADFFFSEIRNQIGPSLDFIISGGAPLDEEIFDFFEALTIPICNGYGLSETGPVVCMNTLKYRRRSSVGKVINGVKVKIDAETDELYVNGPNVFVSYYQNPTLTSESLFTEIKEDKQITWFKTGDLVNYDSDGFLYINGRSKSMIVLPSGKKVQPEEVELVFLKLSFIKNCCLVFAEDPNSHISKLYLVIEIDPSYSELTRNQILEKLIEQSHQLAGYKKPQGFKFTYEPLPLTTTLKVRRFMVEKNINNYRD